MNKITAAERNKIYQRAAELVHLDEQSIVIDSETVIKTIMDEFSISRQRALSAIAHAAMRMRAKSRAGTAPDTSLHLGDDRRAWLQQRGGIQPTIARLIDDAMKS